KGHAPQHVIGVAVLPVPLLGKEADTIALLRQRGNNRPPSLVRESGVRLTLVGNDLRARRDRLGVRHSSETSHWGDPLEKGRARSALLRTQPPGAGQRVQ